MCKKCEAGYYSVGVPTHDSKCAMCPVEATCYGGDIIVPRAGYYRENQTSNIIECPNKKSCLGGGLDFPYGKCSEGFDGVLCSSGALGYTKVSWNKSQKCYDSSTTYR